MSEKKSDLIRENNELRAENRELRKFVMYVKWLKTDEEFLGLKAVLNRVDEYFNWLKKEEKWAE